jgi:hypothetical protein
MSGLLVAFLGCIGVRLTSLLWLPVGVVGKGVGC